MTDQQPEPTHEEIQELLGVYALDAVDPETAAMIERHLVDCLRCSVEVAQHHEVAGLLANSGGESPAMLWDGIAGQLDGSVPPSWERLASRLEPSSGRPDRVVGSEELPVAPAGPTGAGGSIAASRSTGASDRGAEVVSLESRRRGTRWTTRVATAVAAAAAVVAIIFGAQVSHLHHQVNALQAHPLLSGAEQSALAQPSTRQIKLTGSSTPATVTVVLTKTGTGFVEVDRLSALPGTMTYQLWGVIKGKTISLGLLGSDPSVVPFSVAGDGSVAAFAITAEHAGGVVQSTNTPVVAGEVTA